MPRCKVTDKIVYPRGDIEMPDIYEELDFSQALKNRRIAEALCAENPQETRILENRLRFIEIQRHRKYNDHRIKQRDFFVEQLFGKGLNPYIRRGNEDGNFEPGNDKLVVDDGDFIKAVENENTQSIGGVHKSDAVSKPMLPLLRSHTLGVHNLGKSDENNGTGVCRDKTFHYSQKQKQVLIDIPNYDSEHTSLNLTSELSSEGKSRVVTPSSPSKEALARIKIPRSPNKRDIRTLRKFPNLLFPKLRDLLNRKENATAEVNKTPSMPSTPLKAPVYYKRVPTIIVNNDDSEELEKQTIDNKHMMKTIVQLSTELPEHLKATAKVQIRQMTNSDRIYERKERLIEENLPILQREHSLTDRRWFKLEKSLSPTLGHKWRQLYKSGPWVMDKRHKQKLR